MQLCCHHAALSRALRLTRPATARGAAAAGSGSSAAATASVFIWPRFAAFQQQQHHPGRTICSATGASNSNPEESSSSSSAPRRRRRKSTATPTAAGTAAAAAATPPSLKVQEQQQLQQQQQPQGLQFGPQPAHPAFDSVQGWVVFSDLHVSHKTLDTALQVLRQVHREAKEQQAGVLFLGDFWDRRGDLPVIPLNRVQEELSSWRVPLLLLPGNHDQVDLGGLHHSLEPLQLAAAAAHAFTQPTLYRGSLWLPYRRDESSVRATIAAAMQLSSSSSSAGGRLKAIFGHADVQSAHYNAAHQARDGLPPSLFPAAIPVYMGHYHFPHTVDGTAITYVGSPYQVSWSEAGQQKRLLLLDTDWQMTGQIPLDIGRRFHSFNFPSSSSSSSSGGAINRAAAAAGSDSGSESDSISGLEDEVAAVAATAVEAGLSSGSSSSGPGLVLTPELAQGLINDGVLRPGDFVRLAAAEDQGGQGAAVTLVQQLLQQQGIQVQLQVQPAARPVARIQSAEQLSLSQLLELYAANTGMPKDVAALAQATLQELGGQSSHNPQHSHLELHSLMVEGFGPFRAAVTYPLSDRGVVAVTGCNEDDVTTISNGAGKTSLLTALLWAFKAPDGRGMTYADYINEDSRRAEVTVTGLINKEPFEVVRSATRTKSKLSLKVNGQDLTSQEQRMTQEQLEARFSASLLPKTLVFTQEDLLGLLQSNDAAFKSMLSSIVDTNSWAAAKDAAAAHRAKADRAAVAATARKSQLQSDVAAGGQRLQQLLEQQQQWEQEQQQRKMLTRQAEQTAVISATTAAADAAGLMLQLDTALAAARQQQQELATAQAAAAEAAAAGERVYAAAAAQQHSAQQQQQPHLVGRQNKLPPDFDWAAAAAEQQPLVLDEQRAQHNLQLQQATTQQLLGQLKAAKLRRSRYQKVNTFGSSNNSSRAATAVAAGAARGAVTQAVTEQQRQQTGLQPVCEQCLQPINVQLYQENLSNMAAAEQVLEQQITAAQSTEQKLAAVLAAATAARQQLEQQQQAAAHALTAQREHILAEIAAQQKAAASEQQRLRRLEQQQAEQQRRQQQQLFDQDRQLREQLSRLQQVVQRINTAVKQLTKTMKTAATRLEMPLLLHNHPAAATTLAAPNANGGSSSSTQVASAAAALCQQAEQLCDALDTAAESVSRARAELQGLAGRQNPYTAGVQQWQQQLEQQQQVLQATVAEVDELDKQLRLWRQVVVAFGRTGIPSFLLEEVLGELQAATSRHLAELAAGMSLQLSATSARRAAGKTGSKARKAAAAASASTLLDDPLSASDDDAALSAAADDYSSSLSVSTAAAAKEEVSKVVFVRAAGGELRQRSVAQLSGGEKKRLALALGLGFAEVVGARARLTSNCLILDEVLEKLDDEGCSRVAALLKRLSYSSVFVVGQAGSFVTKEFAAVDTVVKAGGASTVQLDSRWQPATAAGLP